MLGEMEIGQEHSVVKSVVKNVLLIFITNNIPIYIKAAHQPRINIHMNINYFSGKL